ncbi:MAG: hypothetical protein HYW25_01680 [Candidatus Aenigmarchaeota archaeon]|nr:hypothetical protein [Candidatus Aenigmarchaeota archaeon]
MIKTKRIFLMIIGFFTLISLSIPAFAHCPLCTAATGAVVAGARVAGIDDAVVGTFIGAFIVSTGFWTTRIINKTFNKKLLTAARYHKLQNIFNPYMLSAVFAVMTIASFYVSGLLGAMPEYTFIFGMERLLFGIIMGSILSAASFRFHSLARSMHQNRNYFPMQGIIMPLLVLAAADFGLYVVGLI